MNRKYYESIDLLKLLLLALIILSSYTLVNTSGVPVISMLSFCVGTFYLILGYFVLRDGEGISERIKRSIRHAAIAFAIAAVVYFALNCLVMLITGGSIAGLFGKRAILEFVFLNAWGPNLGGNIWIVHAALYALIIFYFLNKWGLLRYDMHIMIALILFAIVFGEGAGLIGFRFHGYTYIPGCFLTRAMPYMLLGRLIYKARFNRDFGKIKTWMWVIIFFVGAALTFIEMIGLINAGKLAYLNHMIGFIPMSVAIFMVFLNMKRKFRFGRYFADIGNAGFYIYSVIAQVLYLIFSQCFTYVSPVVYGLLGVFTLIITLGLGILYARWKNRGNQKTESEEQTNEASV